MGDSVQEKYNQIMSITLQKLESPLRNSEAVLARIASLLEVDLPQKKKPPATAAQAQPIMIRLTQAENLSNSLLFLEGALQQLNYEPPIPLAESAANVPDPNITRTINSRADLDALLDAISLSGVAQQPVMPLAPGFGAPASPAPAVAAPPAAASQSPRRISYADFAIEDPRQREARPSFSFSDSAPRPAPDLSNYIVQRPAGATSTSTAPNVNPKPAAPQPAAVPAVVAPQPAAAKASSGGGGGDPWSDIENADMDDLMKKMPKWTKGPPCSSEEIDEYKKFMVAKYEAEQKLNTEILRRKKLGQ